MAKLVCKSEEYTRHTQDGEICCDRCPAGQYVLTDCDATKRTVCNDCKRGYFTAAKNHLPHCLKCRTCENNNQKAAGPCPANEDTQCKCTNGYYCNDLSCKHCIPITNCPEGEGVKVKATQTNDTVCAPCQNGTFSDVDDISPCKTHTSCEERGQLLITPGTSIADAICGPRKSHPVCHWELAAGLWSGLVFTTLITLLGVVFWRTKYKSRRTVFSSVRNNPEEALSMPEVHLNAQQLRSLSPVDCHHQESSDENDCVLPFHSTVGLLDNCYIHNQVGNDLHNTDSAVTTSIYESNHLTNGKPEKFPEMPVRIHSEPQDEWCGT